MQRSTSPLHLHVNPKTPVHVHLRPKKKVHIGLLDPDSLGLFFSAESLKLTRDLLRLFQALGEVKMQEKSCSEMSAGRPVSMNQASQ